MTLTLRSIAKRCVSKGEAQTKRDFNHIKYFCFTNDNFMLYSTLSFVSGPVVRRTEAREIRRPERLGK